MSDVINDDALREAMEPVVIKSAEELDAAMEELLGLGMPKRGSLAYLRYRELIDGIYRYESIHVHIGPPDPISAIQFRMEQSGLQQKDLIPYLGSASRVSEILSGKRSLTIPMIRALHKGLGIPLASLLGARDEDNSWDQRELTPDDVQERLREFLESEEGKRKLSMALIQDIRLRYEVARAVRLATPPDMLSPSVSRPTITREQVEEAVERVYKRTLALMKGSKGPGAFASLHECMGKLQEEVREAEEAVHADDVSHFADEMIDVAVAAVFSVACAEAGVFDG